MFNYQTILNKGDQLAERMFSIKPNWDKQVSDDDTSGYVSMKPNSDGQTVASGDTEGPATENVLTQMSIVLFFMYFYIHVYIHV